MINASNEMTRDYDRFALAIGRTILCQPQLEISLAELHKTLSGSGPASVLCRGKKATTLISECRAMLRASTIHQLDSTGALAVLDECKDLNETRNELAHGLWVQEYDEAGHPRPGRWSGTKDSNTGRRRINSRNVEKIELLPERYERASLGLQAVQVAVSALPGSPYDGFYPPEEIQHAQSKLLEWGRNSDT